MADPRANVLKGVTRALEKLGEDLTVKHKITVPNPSNPTLPGVTTTENHLCRGYIYPHERWDPVNMVRYTETMVIMDSKSFNPPFVPVQGDIILDARGNQYRLLDRQNPRLLGDDMCYIHPLGTA